MALRKHVSQAVYARMRGVSRQWIRQLVREGKLTLEGGLVDPEKANAELARNMVGQLHPNPRRAGGHTRVGNSADASPYLQQKMITEHFRAKLMQLRHERESGRLIDKGEVLAAIILANSTVRTRLRAIPRTLAAILAGTQNALEAERIMADAIDAALTELANSL